MPAPTHPTRVISQAPRCDKEVPGDGIMSYHCSMPQGHGSETLDPSDPMPCWAVESARSDRGWKNWAIREQRRLEAAQQPAVASNVIECPTCEQVAMKVTEEGGLCENCGATAEIQQDLNTVNEIGEGLLPGDGLLGSASPDPERDADIREAAQAFSPSPIDPEEIHEAVVQIGRDGCGPEHDPATNPECIMRPAEPVDSDLTIDMATGQMTEHLRTRPEDQTLPSGDESIRDDQSLVIDDMEARRQVGIKRYGQGHRPFNGRNTLLDAYEESLDGAVYLRSLLRARTATKEDLIDALAHGLDKISEESQYPYDISPMAVKLANRVTDYVTLKIEEARAYIEESERAKVPARQQVVSEIRAALTTGPHITDEDGDHIGVAYLLDRLDEIAAATTTEETQR